MATLTMKQLEKFVRVRNKSAFQTNFQFSIDGHDCGINVDKDLGTPRKFAWDGFTGYEWRIRVKGVMGPTIMVEFGRHLYLAGQSEDEQAKLVEILSKATFEQVAA
jgi:hypothetical protein